jgi:hypothetical protein
MPCVLAVFSRSVVREVLDLTVFTDLLELELDRSFGSSNSGIHTYRIQNPPHLGTCAQIPTEACDDDLFSAKYSRLRIAYILTHSRLLVESRAMGCSTLWYTCDVCKESQKNNFARRHARDCICP